MSSEVPVRRTALHAVHLAMGARMIEFGGWEMPVQYTSILKEHAAVRSAAGLFDISHMGEIRVSGTDAAKFLNAMLTNNIDRIAVGNSQYSLLLNERGGVMDDLFIYRIGEQEYLLIVNASHIEEDYQRFLSCKIERVELCNESEGTAALALQGPKSPLILDRVVPGASQQLGHHAIRCFSTEGGSLWIARTGYTGEDGFEMILPATFVERVWNRLLETGESYGLTPCGLGARDTLRIEVCYPLNGHELGPEITPLEAGLERFIDFTKADFFGKKALLAQKATGVLRKAIALVAQPGGPPLRADYPVFYEGKYIGKLTSGVLSPSLQVGIGLALVEAPYAKIGNTVDIGIRGKYFSANIVKKPIYRKH